MRPRRWSGAEISEPNGLLSYVPPGSAGSRMISCGRVTIQAHRLWRDSWFEYDGLLDWLTRRREVNDVCEVGAGAKPVLPPEVIASRELHHTILDVSRAELDKAPDGYHKIQADIARTNFRFPDSVDLVTSAFVAEHVGRPEVFHRNTWSMLRPGGFALHLFPTLYALPFVANRLIPEPVTARLLRRSQPFRRAEGHEAKFRAYYRWCRGPTARQCARLAGVGFEVLAYTGYFGHGYYLHQSSLHRAEQAKAQILVDHPVADLCSYALVLLRKPHGSVPPSPPDRPISALIVSASTRRHIDSGWNPTGAHNPGQRAYVRERMG
jgi:SAM-dependent methyltransferase